MTGKSDTNWISFSDIMTGLMVIFMFISLSFIIEVQKRQAERDEIFEEFKQTKEQLFYELDSVFHDDFDKWNVEFDKDLSIKFTNPEVLFRQGYSDIRPEFVTILNDFLPKYFNVLIQEKYKDKIAEVRIEGHTDDVPAPTYDSDPYIGNIKLSQARSAEVLKFFRNMDYYTTLPSDKEKRIQFWLTANGLSYGRTLDKNKELSAISGKDANDAYSRRVEFRIVTTSDKIVERVIKEISQ